MTALHCFETSGALFPVTRNRIPEEGMFLLIFIAAKLFTAGPSGRAI